MRPRLRDITNETPSEHRLPVIAGRCTLCGHQIDERCICYWASIDGCAGEHATFGEPEEATQ